MDSSIQTNLAGVSVLALAAKTRPAGTMALRKGKATPAPMRPMKALRERCFPVMNFIPGGSL
jgi:hypothetical protein